MFDGLVHRFGQLKPYQRSLLSALVGFIFYSAWAFWVNQQHGFMVATKAACVQGSYSFVLTFFMTTLIEVLFLIFFNILNNYTLIVWTTILLTCCLIFAASWWVNVLAKTPEILKTVILGYVIGGIYTIIYVYGLAEMGEQKNS